MRIVGIEKQEKRKEPGFGVKKGSCDVGIPAKAGENTTLISWSGFCVVHVSILFCEGNPIGCRSSLQNRIYIHQLELEKKKKKTLDMKPK